MNLYESHTQPSNQINVRGDLMPIPDYQLRYPHPRIVEDHDHGGISEVMGCGPGDGLQSFLYFIRLVIGLNGFGDLRRVYVVHGIVGAFFFIDAPLKKRFTDR